MLDKWLANSRLKSALEKFVRKLLVGKLGANTLTITGLVLGVLGAFCVFLSRIPNIEGIMVIIALIFITISFFMDAFDGIVARGEGKTIFGGVLDLFCDRTVEVTIIMAIISTDPIWLIWPGISTLSSIVLCITVFLAIGSALNQQLVEFLDKNGKLLYYPTGIMERSETFLFLFFIVLLNFWLGLLIWFFAILVFITALQRLYKAYQLFYRNKYNK